MPFLLPQTSKVLPRGEEVFALVAGEARWHDVFNPIRASPAQRNNVIGRSGLPGESTIAVSTTITVGCKELKPLFSCVFSRSASSLCNRAVVLDSLSLPVFPIVPTRGRTKFY